MTRILVLSATTGYQLRSFGEAAEKLGVELVFATDRCHKLDDPWQDRAIPVRFHEPDASVRAIVKAAKDWPVHGLVAVGDRPTTLAARAAEALGLPWHPPSGAAASANKQVARERLASAGCYAPWFRTLRAGESLDAIASRPDCPFPWVLKPLGLSGSRGVIRADSVQEARAAEARIRALLARPEVRALRAGLEDTILIEGFVSGPEFALEGVLTRGQLQVFTIFDKPDPLEGPFFEETIYLTPSSLEPAVQRAVHAEIEHAARALGLWHGPVHAEFRPTSGGIFVLEIAARPIGGLCARVLRFNDGTVSLEDVLLRHAAGEDVSSVEREAGAAGVMMIPIPRAGLLKAVRGEDAARAVEGVTSVHVTAKMDQLVEPLPEAGSYLGFIFAAAPTAAAADRSLREAHARLEFVLQAPLPVV